MAVDKLLSCEPSCPIWAGEDAEIAVTSALGDARREIAVSLRDFIKSIA